MAIYQRFWTSLIFLSFAFLRFVFFCELLENKIASKYLVLFGILSAILFRRLTVIFDVRLFTPKSSNERFSRSLNVVALLLLSQVNYLTVSFELN